MLERLAAAYYRLTLGHVWLVTVAVVLLLAGAAYYAQDFRLDASSDSLVLEGDADMQYYREIRARYGADDFLIVTYTPDEELFSDASIDRLASMRDDLAELDFVSGVFSMLDVPLIDSPRQTLSDIASGTRTLQDDDVDRDLVREEFRTSPLYRDLLMNRDADTTAMLVTLQADEELTELGQRRDELRLQRADEGLDAAEQEELAEVEAAYTRRSAALQADLEAAIADVRMILDDYRDGARIHLGGVPMITADMIEFVRGDIRTFGIAVAVFIVALLAVAFARVRWVVVPSAICAGVALGMVGFLGFMGWPVTVVSSNFISLVLIITLSLLVHLIVRHRELHALSPDAPQSQLLRETIDSKFKPSFFTAITTFVAFAALMLADIRPVIDFGLMMACAVAFSFVLAFVLFPVMLARTQPGPTPRPRADITASIMRGFARLVDRRAAGVWVVFAVVAVVAVVGMTRLSVENRFIDYFHSSTEIHQGMVLIDQELGGTTPLDVVLDAPAEFLEEDEEEFDEWDDYGQDEGPTTGYWFNEFLMEEVGEMHAWLDDFQATGKILSIATTHEMITHLNEGQPPDTVRMAVIYQRLPEDLREILYDPYMSEDGNQLRFDIRIIDSDPDLNRNELLRDIRQGLPERFDLDDDQVNLSGMLVLYNNVMQSLLTSQFVTMAIVFAVIMLMFGLLFRSLKMALIGPLPTLIAACTVLGFMGLFGIPLDIMTITIAAITIGIGVHDTIHYTDRFNTEVKMHGDYDRALHESHANVGRAMFYTTVIVTLGFSILVLSNFIPTIYFGLFTGLAMIFALVSNLSLLPLLIRRLRPFRVA